MSMDTFKCDSGLNISFVITFMLLSALFWMILPIRTIVSRLYLSLIILIDGFESVRHTESWTIIRLRGQCVKVFHNPMASGSRVVYSRDRSVGNRSKWVAGMQHNCTCEPDPQSSELKHTIIQIDMINEYEEGTAIQSNAESDTPQLQSSGSGMGKKKHVSTSVQKRTSACRIGHVQNHRKYISPGARAWEEMGEYITVRSSVTRASNNRGQ